MENELKTNEEEEVKEEETKLTDEEEFDQAWDEEESDGETPVNEDSEEQPLEEDEPNDGDFEDHDTPPQEDSGEEEENPAQDQADATQLQSRIEQLQSENQALEQRMKSWEGRIRAANKRAEEAEAKLKQAQEEQDKADSLPEDEEDDAVLSEFIDEFPTLEKPIKRMIQKVAGEMVKKELDKVENRVQKVEDTQAESASDQHVRLITEAHPDWRQIYDSGKLQTWIDQQSSFTQRALNEVVANGSVQDIIEMFDQYKAANAPADPSAPSSNPKTGRSKSARAAAMQAVPAKTGGPPKPKPKVAEDDFDGAWEEAISKD